MAGFCVRIRNSYHVRIGEFQLRIQGKQMQEILADITAGYKVLFYSGGDYTGPQGNAAGAQLADQYVRGWCIRFFDLLNQRMIVDGKREKLTCLVQIGFIGDLDIQKIGIDGGFVKITVVDDTQIHLGIGNDYAAVVEYILDDRIAQIDGFYVTGDLHPVDGNLDTVADIKRLEKGQNKTVYDVGKAFLEHKAQYNDQQRRRHQDRIIKLSHGIRKTADLNQEKDNDQRLEDAADKVHVNGIFLFGRFKNKIHYFNQGQHDDDHDRCFDDIGFPQDFDSFKNLFFRNDRYHRCGNICDNCVQKAYSFLAAALCSSCLQMIYCNGNCLHGIGYTEQSGQVSFCLLYIPAVQKRK